MFGIGFCCGTSVEVIPRVQVFCIVFCVFAIGALRFFSVLVLVCVLAALTIHAFFWKFCELLVRHFHPCAFMKIRLACATIAMMLLLLFATMSTRIPCGYN